MPIEGQTVEVKSMPPEDRLDPMRDWTPGEWASWAMFDIPDYVPEPEASVYVLHSQITDAIRGYNQRHPIKEQIKEPPNPKLEALEEATVKAIRVCRDLRMQIGRPCLTTVTIENGQLDIKINGIWVCGDSNPSVDGCLKRYHAILEGMKLTTGDD